MPPEECRRCLDGNRSPKGTKNRPDKKKREERKEKEKPSEFATLKRGVTPQPRALVKDGPYYTGLIPGKTETRLEHLEHHIPGSSHDWTTAKLAAQAGQRSSSSPSAFSSGTDYRGLIANAQMYFNTADGERVREYAQHGRIYRVTLLDDHDRLEITVIESVSGGNYGLVSTFDDETAPYVTRQGWYN